MKKGIIGSILKGMLLVYSFDFVKLSPPKILEIENDKQAFEKDMNNIKNDFIKVTNEFKKEYSKV